MGCSDDDEDVGKIVTDEIPRGLYKMGMEASLLKSKILETYAYIEKKKIRRIRSGCRMASLIDRQNKQARVTTTRVTTKCLVKILLVE